MAFSWLTNISSGEKILHESMREIVQGIANMEAYQAIPSGNQFTPAKTNYTIADVAVGQQATIVTNGDSTKTVTATGTDPIVNIGNSLGVSSIIAGKILRFDITIPAGATLDGNIGFYIKGSTPGAYTEITGLNTLMPPLVAGQRNIREIVLPLTTYPYALCRLDIVGAVGNTYTINSVSISDPAFSTTSPSEKAKILTATAMNARTAIDYIHNYRYSITHACQPYCSTICSTYNATAYSGDNAPNNTTYKTSN